MKGKRLLILGAAFALGISACAQATSLVRQNPYKASSASSTTITLDCASNGDGWVTSANESENTITVGDFVFGYKSCYYSTYSGNNYVMMAKSAGVIYNKTPIPNISSISFTYTSSTSEKAKVLINQSNEVIDARQTSGYTDSLNVVKSGTSTTSGTYTNEYVAFSVSNANNIQVAQIEINYSAGGQSLTPITLNKTSLSLNSDDTFQLTASDNNGAVAGVTWSSSDTDVATVNAGLVTAIGGGTATITASADGHNSATCSVTVIEKITVAEALEIIDDLNDGGVTSVNYAIDGYIIAVTTDWSTQYNNITYTLGDTADQQTNLLTVFRSGAAEGTDGSKLKASDKVNVVGKLKKYVTGGLTTPEVDSGCVTTLLEAGETPEPTPIEATVAEAVAAANALENNTQSSGKYIVEGYIVEVTVAWGSQGNYVNYTMGDTANQTSDLLTVYHSGVVDGTVGADLKAGDQVSVTGNLKKYNSTLELVNCTTELLEPGPNHPINVDPTSVAEVKTVAEIKACTAVDNSLIAKVTGVAENTYGNAQYGNFHLVDTSTGDDIVVYGGYSDATFQKVGNEYSSNITNAHAITSAIVGHVVTVYSTIGVHNEVGQLVNALVVDSEVAAVVNASVSVNDNTMGSATLSATTSITYGTEITVSPVPAEGYQVKSVTVERATKTDTVELVNNSYKFNAEAKNVVLVTFEEKPVVEPVVGIVSLASSVSVGDKVFLAANAVSKQYAGPNNANASAIGLASDFDGEEPNKNGLLLEVCGGSEDGTFAFKLLSGDYADEYLAWSSSNSLKVSGTLDANSSWTVSFDENNNATIANAADNARVIWWNVGSPRFACYTSKTDGDSYKYTQLWKFITPETYLKSTTSIATLAATENEGEVSGVSITLGATISEETWNAINANWPITAYGLMSARRTSASSKTVIEAYRDGFAVADKRIEVNGAPNFENGSYTFTAKINVSNYNTLFGVAPYIIAGGQLYFLEELDYSVKELAQEYLAAEDYSVLSQDVLNILAGN